MIEQGPVQGGRPLAIFPRFTASPRFGEPAYGIVRKPCLARSRSKAKGTSAPDWTMACGSRADELLPAVG